MMSISKTGVSKTITISAIQGLGFSFGFSLGNMNSASRVGNISSSTSIGTGNSWNSSGSSSMDSDSVGYVGRGVSNSVVDRGDMVDGMVDWGSIAYSMMYRGGVADSMMDRGNVMSSISYSMVDRGSISMMVGICFSRHKCCATSLK